MPDTQSKEQTSRIIPMTADDLILMRLEYLHDEFRESRKDLSDRMTRLETQLNNTRKDLNDRMDRLENRQDKLEARMDKIDAKIDGTRKELSDRMDRLESKIDALAGKIDSAMNHGQIITVSAISIAVGVLYAMFFK